MLEEFRGYMFARYGIYSTCWLPSCGVLIMYTIRVDMARPLGLSAPVFLEEQMGIFYNLDYFCIWHRYTGPTLLLLIKCLYLSGVFNRDWTTCSKFVNHL